MLVREACYSQVIKKKIEERSYNLGIRVIELREKDLKKLHESHPGTSRMKSLDRSHIRFSNIDHEIEKIVNSCRDCKRVANELNKSSPLAWN